MTKLPAHIDKAKLPKGIWFDTSGKGRWMRKYKDELGRWRSFMLCPATSTLAQIWSAHEAGNEKAALTFSALSNDFQKTIIWQKLSPLTQNDYRNCHTSIITRQTSTGKLGSLAISNWTTGLVRKYRDKRGTESESRANKELAYMRRLFAWAYEYEKITTNPAKGISKFKIPPRQHYIEDDDYYRFLEHAKRSNYWYLPHAIEIAYLCRMRMIEVLDINDADALPSGLLTRRRKGSKTNITEWSPRLEKAWKEAIKKRDQILGKRKQPYPISAGERLVFINEKNGQRVKGSSLETALRRVWATAGSINRFTFHDLKRKGISDFDGEKMKAGGHRSEAMLRIYDVKPDIVKPTK